MNAAVSHRPRHDGGQGRAGAGRGRRAERAVRRAREPGGCRRGRGQRSGDRGVPPGTQAPPAHQLLHRVAGRRRPARGPGGHTVRRAGQRRAAPSHAHVRVLRVAHHRLVHRLHIQPGGRVRRPVLGHTLPDGLLDQLKHQDRSQYVRATLHLHVWSRIR